MDTVTCPALSEQLASVAEWSSATPEAIVTHLAACPSCQSRFGYLMTALQSGDDDSLTCDACEIKLPDYIQAEEASLADTTLWQPVRQHLATCPHCATAYADLASLLAFATDMEVENLPTAYPTPDLSFLQSDLQAPVWRLDELGRLIIDLTKSWLQASQATSPPTLAAAPLKSQHPQHRRELPMIEATANLNVQLTFEQLSETTHSRLIVLADIPDRGGWPNLDGTEIEVQLDSSLFGRKETDAFGKAVFSNIPLEQFQDLSIVVTLP